LASSREILFECLVRSREEREVISLIEAHQSDLIQKIREHCGLWDDPSSPSL
jgi:hypothetical protein